MDRLSEAAFSWLKIWGHAALYWCPGEVYVELHNAGFIQNEKLTEAGRAALARAGEKEG